MIGWISRTHTLMDPTAYVYFIYIYSYLVP